ncbi:type II toxin-antitoxin system ParD family antitoxin [Rhodococcus sp. T9N]|uniref:type II toxin-antitoxin system ParD family antitoxin n=1 Tax=Rhodococcus sp. T9N TaxID=627445 RepID=UPI0021C254EC|nr:type II toxin-antitoxin system ParD family antitoxin [Rhodococcus sp. T9N]
MSTQIAVRLPEDIVAFLDSEVSGGRAKSRAQVVLRALEREQRRQLAVRDVEILSDGAGTSSDVNIAAAHGRKI